MELPIGQTIRILRQAKKLKLNELARATRVSSPFLCLVESGERQPSIDVLRRVGEALGVDGKLLLTLAGAGKISSKDRASTSIARSVGQMIDIERKLQEALESEDSTRATKRRHAK